MVLRPSEWVENLVVFFQEFGFPELRFFSFFNFCGFDFFSLGNPLVSLAWLLCLS